MPTTILLEPEAISYREPPLACLLSGTAVTSTHSVRLRRMIFIGPIWVGEQIVIPMPLAMPLRLFGFQCLRTFRWVVAALLPLAVVNFLEFPIDLQWVKTAVYVATAIAAWMVMGVILRREPFRLLGVGRDGRWRIRFRDDGVARRFTDQLVSGRIETDASRA